jgi:hypothetical protein
MPFSSSASSPINAMLSVVPAGVNWIMAVGGGSNPDGKITPGSFTLKLALLLQSSPFTVKLTLTCRPSPTSAQQKLIGFVVLLVTAFSTLLSSVSWYDAKMLPGIVHVLMATVLPGSQTS